MLMKRKWLASAWNRTPIVESLYWLSYPGSHSSANLWAGRNPLPVIYVRWN